MSTYGAKQELEPVVTDNLPYYQYDGFFKPAVEVAEFYGFKLIQPIKVTQKDRVNTLSYQYSSEQVALLRKYIDNQMDAWSEPALLVYTRKTPYKKGRQLRLDIVGTEHSNAEGLLMKTTQAILDEYGHKNVGVGVNSIGGKNSTANFLKELTQHYRNNSDKIEANCRETLKQSSFAVHECRNKKCSIVKEGAPRSLSFLTEKSRRHFKEVLECLEGLDIPYVIDNGLVGDKNYTTRTVFEFRSFNKDVTDDDFAPLGRGERFDYLSKKAGLGKSIPAIGVTIDLGCNKLVEKYKDSNPDNQKRAKAFIIQIGPRARTLVLRSSDTLRKSGIAVNMSVKGHGLSEQLRLAYSYGVPYLVIIGQKEVAEKIAIVRNVSTNRQESVPIERLVSILKKGL
jgi:histidyl-tRNA synthetase